MELTVSFRCFIPSCYCGEQTVTINIRRGQRKEIKCGYCENTAVTIQGNRTRKGKRV